MALTYFIRYRSKDISIETRRWDPVTATFSSLAGTTAGMVETTSGVFLEPYREYSRSRKTPKATVQEQIPAQSSEESKRTFQSIIRDSTTDNESRRTEVSSDLASVISHDTTASVSRRRIAAAMATASGKSVGKIYCSYTKGILVDLPLATAEGFRMMPRLWGQEVKDYGQVTDWRTGAAVAGRPLVKGIGDGLLDIATLPVKGGQEEGTWGAVKGVAKGTASLVTSDLVQPNALLR